jgi:hypothetical protein
MTLSQHEEIWTWGSTVPTCQRCEKRPGTCFVSVQYAPVSTGAGAYFCETCLFVFARSLPVGYPEPERITHQSKT